MRWGIIILKFKTKYFWEFFEGVTFFLFFVDDGSQWQRRSWSYRLLLSCETLLFNCVFRWQNWLQWQRDSLQLCWWSLPSIDDKITDRNLWAAQTLKQEEIRKHDIQDGPKHGRQDRRIHSHVSWGCMWRTLLWNFKKMHPDINHQLFFNSNMSEPALILSTLSASRPKQACNMRDHPAQTLETLSQIFLHSHLLWWRSRTVLTITQTNRKYLRRARALSQHLHICSSRSGPTGVFKRGLAGLQHAVHRGCESDWVSVTLPVDYCSHTMTI